MLPIRCGSPPALESFSRWNDDVQAHDDDLDDTAKKKTFSKKLHVLKCWKKTSESTSNRLFPSLNRPLESSQAAIWLLCFLPHKRNSSYQTSTLATTRKAKALVSSPLKAFSHASPSLHATPLVVGSLPPIFRFRACTTTFGRNGTRRCCRRSPTRSSGCSKSRIQVTSRCAWSVGS